ncbi:hypothetical protein PIB30_025297 [Stylosanthes scabra]|uniref:Uncharacterized protein n=1 Tax=Stylosanthes scabra TaxID=79078 RepID=A0ABU6VAZ0_9FABA|nr:hypothetical protein [Stylosanthes scabra]
MRRMNARSRRRQLGAMENRGSRADTGVTPITVEEENGSPSRLEEANLVGKENSATVIQAMLKDLKDAMQEESKYMRQKLADQGCEMAKLVEKNDVLGQAVETLMAKGVHGTTVLATSNATLYRSAPPKVNRAFVSDHSFKYALKVGNAGISTIRKSGRKRDLNSKSIHAEISDEENIHNNSKQLNRNIDFDDTDDNSEELSDVKQETLGSPFTYWTHNQCHSCFEMPWARKRCIAWPQDMWSNQKKVIDLVVGMLSNEKDSLTWFLPTMFSQMAFHPLEYDTLTIDYMRDRNNFGVWVAEWMKHSYMWDGFVEEITEETRMKLALELIMGKHNPVAEDKINLAISTWDKSVHDADAKMKRKKNKKKKKVVHKETKFTSAYVD